LLFLIFSKTSAKIRSNDFFKTIKFGDEGIFLATVIAESLNNLIFFCLMPIAAKQSPYIIVIAGSSENFLF